MNQYKEIILESLEKNLRSYKTMKGDRIRSIENQKESATPEHLAKLEKQLQNKIDKIEEITEAIAFIRG